MVQRHVAPANIAAVMQRTSVQWLRLGLLNARRNNAIVCEGEKPKKAMWFRIDSAVRTPFCLSQTHTVGELNFICLDGIIEWSLLSFVRYGRFGNAARAASSRADLCPLLGTYNYKLLSIKCYE